jgi:DNA-binding transcriptional ArsR family regulator
VLDEDLQSFVRATIRTVWSLELLILMRAYPARKWIEGALVRELRASHTSVAQALAAFETAGLVRRDQDGTISYAPATPVLEEICDRLERAYRERPVAVINVIMSAPDERLRTFADAFRLKPSGD